MPASVYLKPSLTLSIPKSSITLTLDPSSTAFSSDSINIEVGTNNASGYKLYVSTENNSTDLVNTIDNTKTIQTLSTSTPESSFPVNNWGYKLNSGDYLPFTSGALVNSSTGPVNSSATTFTVGAKVDYTKDAGTYQTNLQFNTVPEVAMHYMQDLQDPTLAQRICTSDGPTMVMDKRDEQVYTIRRINGNCWMIDNLRLGYNSNNPNTTTITLTPEDSNVTEERAITAYDLVTYGGSGEKCYGTADDPGFSGLGYTTPCIRSKNTTSDTIGVWYNYAMATAGTIASAGSATDSAPATESICPSGWELPSATKFATINNSIYKTIFNATVSGGTYTNGSNTDTGTAAWWSSTYTSSGSGAGRGTYRYKSDSDITEIGWNRRRMGIYVRCILQE